MYDGLGITHIEILPLPKPVRPRVADVQRVVAAANGLTMDDMKSEDRRWSVAHPRMLAMYLAREMTGNSYPQIGSVFGGKDHTTVLFACRKIIAQAKHIPALVDVLGEYRSAILVIANDREREVPNTLPLMPALKRGMKTWYTAMPQDIAQRADWMALGGELEPA